MAALSTFLCDVLDFLLSQSEMRIDKWGWQTADLGAVGEVARIIIARHFQYKVVSSRGEMGLVVYL